MSKLLKRWERQRQIFHHLDHSTNDCDGQICASLKPEFKNFLQVFYMVLEPKALHSLLLIPQAISKELDWSGVSGN